MKWFERHFELGLPGEMLPCILERLRGTPARLEEMIRTYSGNLTQRVNNGWSIQEHVGHLFDLDTLHDGRIDDFKAHATVLRPADLTNKKTWEANHNSSAIENLLARFRTARAHFVKRLEELDDDTLAVVSLHPRLQKQMRVVDMAFFVAEHDDHHLAAIRQLMRL